jgi:ubiquinone/menaquinone biosynthesis C-methylase UbiE
MEKEMAEQVWDSFARLNAGERFKAQSAEMGEAVTAAIVEAAQVGPGMRVLDVACGSGEPSISIATLLKGTGQVMGVDMASMPLDVARKRAQKRGLTNVEFLQGDVHALPFAGESFDRVTCRLGVMFFGDLARALLELRRVLRPGGRISLLAWGEMEQPYFDLTIGTVRRMRPGIEVPVGAREMFKFGRPGSLSSALAGAGFRAAEESTQELKWDWHGSSEELWDYFRGVTVPFRALLEKVDGDEEVDRAVLAALRERQQGEWVKINAHMVVASAERG